MTNRACRDCRHGIGFHSLLEPVAIWNGPMCFHPARKTFDPVEGVVTKPLNCAAARTEDRDCGPDARLYEPKLRVRLVNFLKSVIGGYANV